jgi:crotonobetainyl-CoA:carnitine CoA-transferase CaiB-like acyl-CoA transferase
MESLFQPRHVPAARGRTLAEAVRNPQFFGPSGDPPPACAAGVEGGLDVPLAASNSRRPAEHRDAATGTGAETDYIFAEHGYNTEQIAAFAGPRLFDRAAIRLYLVCLR